MIFFSRGIKFVLILLCTLLIAQQSRAEYSAAIDQVQYEQRVALAKSFVSRLKKRLQQVQEEIVRANGGTPENILPDGEVLLLRVVLEKSFRPDGIVFGQVRDAGVLVSLSDFADTLQLAINVDAETQTASGWYIKEDKPFYLDVAQKNVRTDHGEFTASDKIFFENSDIFVPVDELGHWLSFDLDIIISAQELKVKSDEILPIQAKYNRSKLKIYDRQVLKPKLPLMDDGYKLASVPIVDVSTSSTYTKNSGQSEGKRSHSANITTVGDFAKGTLTTRSRVNDEHQLASTRATFKQESVSGDLLGPLKAKRVEVGDITTVNTSLGGQVSQELGVRITNTDPLRNFLRATTAISGVAIPGWDIELFRNGQFLNVFKVGDDGFYSFEDVVLFHDDNNFRLVFYGPQGEVREENVFVPFDSSLQSRGGGIYDISVSFDGENTYTDVDKKSTNEDSGSINVAALYERPLGGGITGSVGLRSGQLDGERNTVGSVGLSATVKEALVNVDLAVDDEGEISTELSVRKDFAEHALNFRSQWRQANFDETMNFTDGDLDVFQNSISVNGPMPFVSSLSPNYSASISHRAEAGGDSLLLTSAGLNGGWRNLSFAGNVRHQTGDALDDDKLDSTFSLFGARGKDRLRLTANYEIAPNAALETMAASYSRRLTKKLDADFNVTKNQNESKTEYQARMDWQAGFIRISPSIRYDTDQDFFAGLNTRFGLTQEPLTGKMRMFDHNITNHAFASAFVYLDKNGDGTFNNDDEPLKDVIVSAPQNSRRATTDDKGIALFSRMTRLRKTDIFIDRETLQDPAWIPGFKGVSIIPREGYVAQVEFPVHLSGELDGTIYAKVVPLPFDKQNQELGGMEALPAQPVPLRNIELYLYNDKGETEQKTLTDSGGFYYFANVPPGRYYLMIDEKSAARKNIIRPKPQAVEFGYEGTLIYDNKIFVDTGAGDIPSEIIADMKEFKERHPNVEFSDEDSYLVLNLGEYSSRLLMSVVWYKLRTRYGGIIGNMSQPLVPAAQSYANPKTGKHMLRVGLEGETLDSAYTMCKSLMARGQACKVEIYPSYIKQASAAPLSLLNK